jgi:uncharacterized protein YidB (DUF937 family)
MGLMDELGADLEGAMKTVLSQALQEAVNNPAILQQVLQKTDLGSLNGLVEKLQKAGLGPAVQSWLSNGANIPVTEQQIQAALGDDQVRQIADAMGLPADQVLPLLAKYLPTIVDALSPHGKLQTQGT